MKLLKKSKSISITSEQQQSSTLSISNPNEQQSQVLTQIPNQQQRSNNTKPDKSAMFNLIHLVGLKQNEILAPEKKESHVMELKKFKTIIKPSANLEDFWNQNKTVLPRLYSLTKQYCAMCGASVPSESAFSIAGFINRKQRAAMCPNMIKWSMFLKDAFLFS